MASESISNMQLNKPALEAFRARWQLVTAVEAAEQKESSLLQRWLKLNALIRMAMALDFPRGGDEEARAVVRQRWSQLRTAYHRSSQGAQFESS